MSTPKLQIAIAGLGRMGKRHALHFQTLTPRASLIAASSPDETEMAWASRNLEGVRLYLSYDEMLEKETAIQAVVVASATTVHAEQATKAIQKGKHVLCEKPLSTSVEVVSRSGMSSGSETGLMICTVTVRRRRGQEATRPQSHVWLLSSFRRLIP